MSGAKKKETSITPIAEELARALRAANLTPRDRRVELTDSSMDEILQSVRRIIAENDNPVESVGGGTDDALLIAMDIIANSIEDHNDRWNSMLDIVESDLRKLQHANRAATPSAA